MIFRRTRIERRIGSFNKWILFPHLLIAFILLLGLSITRNARADDNRPLSTPSIEQQAQQKPGGQKTEEAEALERGKLIERELAAGQSHAYQITLADGNYLSVVVEQRGIDVAVKVLGPDGKQIFEFDSESRPEGQEEVSLVVETAGEYRLTVSPRQKEAPAGSYEIRIEELRAAANTDRALHNARKQYEESRKLKHAGKYDEALPLAERALEIRERVVGAEHREVAAAANNLADIYIRRGEHVKAEPLYRRALEIREKALGKDHPDTAEGLNNLSELYWRQGKYGEAELLLKHALEIREKALGKDHPDTAESFNNLALLYREQGKYAEAEPLFKRSLDIHEKTWGKDHPETAANLNNLALLYYSQGKYAETEPLFKRALEIRKKALGKDHPDTAQSLNNLAALYKEQGRYNEAESLYKRALEIWEKALGKDHPETATGISNLAALYWKQGRSTEAEPLYKRALEIWEKTLDKDHPYTAFSLNNLALLYASQGKYAEAEPLLKHALEIREKALGKDHPDTADSLSRLAALYASQGRYVEAEPFYNRTIEIYEKALGKDHPDTANSLDNLAKLYTAKGDPVQAVKFQSLADTASEHNLARNLAIGSERQKLAYLATLSGQTDRTISLHLHVTPDDPVARDLAATVILQRKGRALDATSQNLNTLRSRFNAEDQALLDRLTETRSQLARLILGGPQKMTIEQHRGRIKALEDEAERDEAEIGRRSNEFRAQSLPVTLEAVRAAIPADVALIEFVSYRPFNARAAKGEQAYSQARYVAYVLRHEGEIQWKELGDAKTVDDAIAAFRSALSDPKRRDVKRLARAVDEKLMQPLRVLLGDARQILVSPDGALNLIPFEAMADEQGQYLIERYSFNYLTSGRDLLRLQVERESKNHPLVVADPMFGARDRLAKADLPQRKPARTRLRQSVTTGSDLSSIYFAPLIGAELEAKEIKSLFPEAEVLLGERATEASLKRAVAPRILHIATHGFFLEDRPVRIEGTRGLSLMRGDGELGGLGANVKIENPLLRSGLALAGANGRTGGDDDDGILTALEASGLNLWGTQLVVLSACDTGVGVVKTGEGVYGLRRALALAGSETQVMSLWPVRDYVTQRLMKAYYAQLKQGQGCGEALRNMKLMTMRRRGTEHPFYWAGFIQSGKWTELEDKQ